MEYFGDVYRPPSEARSLIIQATVGCSNNQCTFCSMYRADNFRIRPWEEVRADLEEMVTRYPMIDRIFIADGDALILPTDYWVQMLDFIKDRYKNIQRISAYATALDINRKSHEDLALLRSKGLEMLYIGFETGDDQLLKDIHKNMTREDYIQSMEKAHKAGFKTSITLLAGLGGRGRWQEHAKETASLISITKPHYVSYLTVNLVPGTPLYKDSIEGRFQMPSPEEIQYEIRTFIEEVDAEGTVFRSNHASNYVSLKGTLNKDKENMIATIDHALENKSFRPEYYRSL